MRTFEIESPDGRVLRQNHESLEAIKPKLLPGYKVIGEVFGADAKGNAGMVDRFDEEPLMAKLLEGRNAAFLDEWIMKRMAVHSQSKRKADA